MGDGGKDDEDQLESVHLLASDDISKGTEQELANDGSGRGSEFDGGVGGVGHLADAGVVDNAEHQSQEGDGKDVVAVGEEANASHDDSADVIPSKGGLVDLSKGEPPPLIGVFDVNKVIVEVVVGIVAAYGLGYRCCGHDY